MQLYTVNRDGLKQPIIFFGGEYLLNVAEWAKLTHSGYFMGHFFLGQVVWGSLQ